jgi:hypothetical protein
MGSLITCIFSRNIIRLIKLSTIMCTCNTHGGTRVVGKRECKWIRGRRRNRWEVKQGMGGVDCVQPSEVLAAVL